MPPVHLGATLTSALRCTVPELRQAVARHSEKFNQLPVDWKTETLITIGATEAIAAVLMGVLNAGDEVISHACNVTLAATGLALAHTVPLVETSMLLYDDAGTTDTR